MKTTEQRKAQLLDEFVSYHKDQLNDEQRVNIKIRMLIEDYDEIVSTKPFSKDPYADEVFTGNCGALIINAAIQWNQNHSKQSSRKDLRLSDMPTLSELKQMKNIGKKSLWVYEEVMKEYGFTYKLK